MFFILEEMFVYCWSIGVLEKEILNMGLGIYKVIVIDDFGC